MTGVASVGRASARVVTVAFTQTREHSQLGWHGGQPMPRVTRCKSADMPRQSALLMSHLPVSVNASHGPPAAWVAYVSDPSTKLLTAETKRLETPHALAALLYCSTRMIQFVVCLIKLQLSATATRHPTARATGPPAQQRQRTSRCQICACSMEHKREWMGGEYDEHDGHMQWACTVVMT